MDCREYSRIVQRRCVKGPYLRLRFDFRRRWECPLCHARARSGGDVVSMPCPVCTPAGKTAFMRLVYDGERMLPWRPQASVASVAALASETPAEERDIGETPTLADTESTPEPREELTIVPPPADQTPAAHDGSEPIV